MLKKRIQLKDEHINYLVDLPETGMGYQIINVILKDGQQLLNRIVVDSRLLLLNDNEDIDPNSIEKVELVNK